jgi:hypothetical protein
VKKRTAKIVYRALSDAAHGKGGLPCKMLPCALCHAPRQKTHGKGFAVCFKAFAVRSGRTAKPLFPVVTDEREEEMDIDERKEIILASGRDIKLR